MFLNSLAHEQVTEMTKASIKRIESIFCNCLGFGLTAFKFQLH